MTKNSSQWTTTRLYRSTWLKRRLCRREGETERNDENGEREWQRKNTLWSFKINLSSGELDRFFALQKYNHLRKTIHRMRMIFDRVWRDIVDIFVLLFSSFLAAEANLPWRSSLSDGFSKTNIKWISMCPWSKSGKQIRKRMHRIEFCLTVGLDEIGTELVTIIARVNTSSYCCDHSTKRFGGPQRNRFLFSNASLFFRYHHRGHPPSLTCTHVHQESWKRAVSWCFVQEERSQSEQLDTRWSMAVPFFSATTDHLSQ